MMSQKGPGCVRTVLSAAKARCPVLVSQVRLEARNFRGADRTPKVSLKSEWLAAGVRSPESLYTLHVVGEHIECHLGCDLVSSSHQEVRRTHPSLYGPERMLCRLTTQGHLIGVLIEPLLNLLQHVLVFPTRDAPLGAS